MTRRRCEMEKARREGLADGLANVQHCDRYTRPAVVLAWYEGWQRGQADYWRPIAKRLGLSVDQAKQLNRTRELDEVAVRLAQPINRRKAA